MRLYGNDLAFQERAVPWPPGLSGIPYWPVVFAAMMTQWATKQKNTFRVGLSATDKFCLTVV